MTTVAAQVPTIRRILNDNPVEAHLNGAISDTTTETFVVDSTDISKFELGQVWEHATGGELRRIYSIDVDNLTPSAYRGYKGTTAATQADNSFVYLEPRFEYATIEQAINTCLDQDLFPDVYEIVEHQVTSSSTTNYYNAPATACEEFLDVYQRINSTDGPTRTGIRYSVFPQNADTTLWANGKVFYIAGGTADGSAVYYVNCKHRLAIGTLLSRQERLLQVCAAKYLLEWTSPRRLAGPTNQGDRSVRPNDPVATAAYYEGEFRRLRAQEAEWLKDQVPRRKLYVGSGPVIYQSEG